MAEPDNSFRKLRRTASMRNGLIGTVAAFAGGGLVVSLQALFALAGARYPPIIQGLHCNFARPAGTGTGGAAAPSADLADGDAATNSDGDLVTGDGRLLPSVAAGDEINCFLDSPGADYAAWAMAGRMLEFRSGPLDAELPCQDAQAFSAQSPDDLRLSACQTFRLTEPGEYRLVMKVAARGYGAVDREQLLFIVRPRLPETPPPTEPPVATRVQATLILPGQTLSQTRTVPVSESLSAHGLLPTTRDYSFVVYRLGKGETYVGSRFQANSASNASRTKVTYQPKARAVAISFTLRSGPFVDRWRGWISGSVAVQVKRQDAAQNVVLPDMDLHVPGRTVVALPDETPAARLEGARIHFVRSESGKSADVIIGQTVALDNADITPRVDGNDLVIEARLRGR